MRGRFVLLGLCASVGSAALAASPGAESGTPATGKPLRLNCSGMMLAAGQPAPGSPTLANGFIDFAGERVRGFGVGSQPILTLTASLITFGSSLPDGSWHGNVVEGSIDRQTGVTRVVVRSPRDPSEIRIDLALECEFERPVS